MDVQVGQIALPQDDQMPVGTEVGLQVGDRPTVPLDCQDEPRVGPGREPAGQRLGVAVDAVGAVLAGRAAGMVVARDREVGAEGEADPAGRVEVGEQPPCARRQVEGRGPGAAAPELGVDVLEAGQVAANGDQVQLLAVVDVVRLDRPAVGALDHERDGYGGSGRGRGLLELERVAGLGHHQPAGDLLVHGRRLRRVMAVVGGVHVFGHVLGDRRGDRADGVPDSERAREHERQHAEEAEDTEGTGHPHASW